MNDQDNSAKRAEILRNLVEGRKRAGLRQADVAEAMGVGQPSISELERGETSPKLETLQRYADAIGVDMVIYLSGGKEADNG